MVNQGQPPLPAARAARARLLGPGLLSLEAFLGSQPRSWENPLKTRA